MRKSDKVKRNYKRSSRYQLVNDKWYFKAREGDLLGPYDSPTDAAKAIENYIDLMPAEGIEIARCLTQKARMLSREITRM